VFAQGDELMSATTDAMPVLVKYYAAIRLYDTTHRRYVSIEQFRGWAEAGVEFAIIDTHTGADVTRVLLA
jgi:polyhydroxyalkanoate synthesis regulator protein